MSAEALALAADERAAAAEEVLALAGALADPARRRPLEELAQALRAGEPSGPISDPTDRSDPSDRPDPPFPHALDLSPAQLERLTQVLELTLESGRARRFQGAEGEGALRRLYARTPRGAALRRQAEAASRAAAALAGRTLSRLELSAVGPGRHRLEIETADCRLSFEIGRAGISVESLGVEL